ncbi:MAG: hypothetical protein M3404_01360 [Actinomycetota bacterium]|nr:hypothetical protein [Actinomycetota bacterium]
MWLLLAEVARCTRDGIAINTFMLEATSYPKAFVDKLARLNRGGAFFVTHPRRSLTISSWTSSSTRPLAVRLHEGLSGRPGWRS